MSETLISHQQDKKTSERQRHILTTDSEVIGEYILSNLPPIKEVDHVTDFWVQDEYDVIDISVNPIIGVEVSGLNRISNTSVVNSQVCFIATASVAGHRSIDDQLGIVKLGISYNITKDAVKMLVDKPTMEAAKIVVGVLSNRISNGLPIRHIEVERLEDIDAGLWEELVFVINVDLSSKVANEEWDKIIYGISGIAEKHADKDVSYSLSERIGIHFTWMKNR